MADVSHIKIGDLVKAEWYSITLVCRVSKARDPNNKIIYYHDFNTANNGIRFIYRKHKHIANLESAIRVTKLG